MHTSEELRKHMNSVVCDNSNCCHSKMLKNIFVCLCDTTLQVPHTYLFMLCCVASVLLLATFSIIVVGIAVVIAVAVTCLLTLDGDDGDGYSDVDDHHDGDGGSKPYFSIYMHMHMQQQKYAKVCV